MSATRDGKMWRCQFYYKDWQGVTHKKTKGDLRQKQKRNSGSVISCNNNRGIWTSILKILCRSIMRIWNTVCVKILCGQRDSLLT